MAVASAVVFWNHLSESEQIYAVACNAISGQLV